MKGSKKDPVIGRVVSSRCLILARLEELYNGIKRKIEDIRLGFGGRSCHIVIVVGLSNDVRIFVFYLSTFSIHDKRLSYGPFNDTAPLFHVPSHPNV